MGLFDWQKLRMMPFLCLLLRQTSVANLAKACGGYAAPEILKQ